MNDPLIRIASYNIRKARGLDQKRLPERTLAVINALNADIVVLQEADRRMGVRKPAIPRKLIEEETDFELVDVSTNGVSIGWHGNAILTRRPHQVTGVSRVELPGLEPRGAIRVDLDIGKEVSLVAAHLGLRRRDRRAQLEAIAEATKDRARVVIAGDFNEWSPSRGLEPIEERFETHSPGHSFHARRPIAALDRFALSEGIELRDAGVAQGATARIASDHLPIWSDITVSSATC